MNSDIFIIMLVLVVLVFMNSYLPIKGKKGILFGAIVEEEEKVSEPFSTIIDKYKKLNILSGAIFFIIIFIGSFFNVNWISSVCIILYIGCNFIVSAKMHKLVLEVKKKKKIIKKQKVVATLEKARLSKSRIAYYIMIVLVFIFINGYELITKYKNLPEKIPTHFNIHGVADGWINKSSGGAFVMIGIIIGMIILYIGIDILTYKSTLKIDPKNREGSYKANIKSKKLLSIMLGLTMIPVLITLTVSNLVTLKVLNEYIFKYILWIQLVTIVGVIGFCIVIIKAKNNYEIKDKDVTFRDDDKYWKFGMIYYNKENPKIFVEKRMGIGFTVNAGRPLGMAFYIGTIILLIFCIILPIIL